MLARLQKQLDKQKAKAAPEYDKATILRDAATCIYNQLLAHIVVFRGAQTRGSDKESRMHPLQPRTTDTTCTRGSQRHHRSTSHAMRNDESEPHKLTKTPRIEDLVGRSGSGSMETIRSPIVG